jgi:flagellar basal-body rod protein FlgC
MSAVFGILQVAKSGMGVYKTWLNAVADNIANIDNVTDTSTPAFQERFVQVSAVEAENGWGGGAAVVGADFGDPNGRVSYDPNHPLADENGFVRRPDLDLTDQMVYLQLAQRGYQANVQTFERARDAYESILSIGK